MKLAMVVVLAMACGKSGDATKSAPGSGAAPPPTAAAPAKKGVTGSVTTSGALTGTWQWKDDMALDCSWIPNIGMGAIDVTLSDGADGAAALRGLFSKDRTEVILTSGKLKSPSPFKQSAGGVVITGTGNTGGDAPVTVTAQFDAVTTRDAETINVKGTLTARCN